MILLGLVYVDSSLIVVIADVYLCQGGYVFVVFCLSVCVFATLCKNS